MAKKDMLTMLEERSLDNLNRLYVPSAKTDVIKTFRRMGWIPPSEDPAVVAKWRVYKHLAAHNESLEELQDGDATTPFATVAKALVIQAFTGTKKRTSKGGSREQAK